MQTSALPPRSDLPPTIPPGSAPPSERAVAEASAAVRGMARAALRRLEEDRDLAAFYVRLQTAWHAASECYGVPPVLLRGAIEAGAGIRRAS